MKPWHAIGIVILTIIQLACSTHFVMRRSGKSIDVNFKPATRPTDKGSVDIEIDASADDVSNRQQGQ